MSVMYPQCSLIYKKRKELERLKLNDKYSILGFISSGTYGNVYKAISKRGDATRLFAIKQFKPDVGADLPSYNGISQSAIRELSICREIRHEHVIFLHECILDPVERTIAMVFDYTEHDLLQILHYHNHVERRPIPMGMVKSLLFQILNGTLYLHLNWIMHRDLKPANILVTADGVVKIADLGLARIFKDPLQSLYHGDKVVVTSWYRSVELLLGARHYTKAIDVWSIGCIFGELLTLRPLCKGEEVPAENNKTIPFQIHQVTKMCHVLGTPSKECWPGIESLPDYQKLLAIQKYPNNLWSVYHRTPFGPGSIQRTESEFALLSALLEYDPEKRLTCDEAMDHPYFLEDPKPSPNCFTFEGVGAYPKRKITAIHHDNLNADAKQRAVQSDSSKAKSSHQGQKRPSESSSSKSNKQPKQH